MKEHAAASLIKASVGVVVRLGASWSIRRRLAGRHACLLAYFDNSNDMRCGTCMYVYASRSSHTHHQSFGWPGRTHACSACRVLWAS